MKRHEPLSRSETEARSTSTSAEVEERIDLEKAANLHHLQMLQDLDADEIEDAPGEAW